MASRTGNYDALIVEEMFGRYTTLPPIIGGALKPWQRQAIQLIIDAQPRLRATT
jgi:hypothetical protein